LATAGRPAQVRDALGLTYDVSFELSLFDRLRVGWFVVHVTSTPAKIHEAAAASLRVLRGLDLSRVTPRELLRARRTVLTRHESEMKARARPPRAACPAGPRALPAARGRALVCLTGRFTSLVCAGGARAGADGERAAAQDNTYRLGLLTHLQRPDVPLKVPECLRDLRAVYEAACIEDIYDAYSQAPRPLLLQSPNPNLTLHQVAQSPLSPLLAGRLVPRRSLHHKCRARNAASAARCRSARHQCATSAVCAAQFNLEDDNVVTCIGTSGPTAPAAQAARDGGAAAERVGGGAGDVPMVDGKVLLAAAAAMQGGRLAEAVRELAMRRSSGGGQAPE